ncbi:type IV toxin-antitoxin system AbiEi family antitoxin domain-containing protein [Actinokineospora sp.]|uniref:type IV toxin-antitoxin system AbiEi family antitoxin domain-containing protein n=1 Tax=Actinokineospora sp. TaxID=1872133 RepID=UPI003D6A066A
MPVEVTDLPPTFTTATARAVGLHPRELYRMRDAGELVELSRGVFRQAEAPAPTLPDLLAVAHRVPTGIVCCVSALAVYDLTDEIPSQPCRSLFHAGNAPRESTTHPPRCFASPSRPSNLGSPAWKQPPERTSGYTALNERWWI